MQTVNQSHDGVPQSPQELQGSWSPLAFLPTIPKWLPRMDGNKFLSKKRLGSLPLDSGDIVAPLAVDCSG